LAKGFKFEKKVMAKDKIEEYKRKRDVKAKGKILPQVAPLVKAQSCNIHRGAQILHKALRTKGELY
jgi:hypothetical protein